MKKMLFIINPRSGKEQIRSRLLEILDSFVKAGYGPSVYITQGPTIMISLCAAAGTVRSTRWYRG